MLYGSFFGIQGRVSLEQILGAFFWKSHSTFTNFYLKDVAWKSKDGSEYSLGPIVSAQHVVHLRYIFYYNVILLNIISGFLLFPLFVWRIHVEKLDV